MAGPTPPNGIGLSGAMRLDRIEHLLDRQGDKLDAIGAEFSKLSNAENRANERAAEAERRIRALELRFYGILAGLITAVGVIVYTGGKP